MRCGACPSMFVYLFERVCMCVCVANMCLSVSARNCCAVAGCMNEIECC